MKAKNKIVFLESLYEKISAEIEKRDMSDVPTDRLILVLPKLAEYITYEKIRMNPFNDD